MHFPRLPDWAIYLAVVAALLFAALGRRERVDAPAAPPPAPGGGGVLLPPASPLDPTIAVHGPLAKGPGAGTAFSVADSGIWITARHVVAGCGRVAIVIADGRGVAARMLPSAGGDIAILATRGGGPALPIAARGGLTRGQRAFHPGFPSGAPGEVASRLVGRGNITTRGGGPAVEPVLVWAEEGRTAGVSDNLAGLSGAPTLDGDGRVVGVTIAQAPRRGRLYTTTPEALRRTLAAAGVKPAPDAAGEPIAADNYGRVADDLRRDLRVAQVVCLSG
jgi:serine protease Do